MRARTILGRAAAMILAATALAPSRAAAHGAHEKEAPPAAEAPLYEPPAPGTYGLPPIRRVSEHALTGTDGKRAPILGLASGRAAIVSFIYLNCADAGGCPLSLAVMQRLDVTLAKRPSLARRVRLVTVSFDPAHDTPARMGEVRGALDPKSDWRFFTARDDATLAPVLADYDQDAARVFTETGKETSRIQHVLKVFLVDGRGDVRNIYSTGFLDERLLINDLETVLR
jgi:cytochrome oxidase Cu insertion factor (SCO1/SenC/PrrC family)